MKSRLLAVAFLCVAGLAAGGSAMGGDTDQPSASSRPASMIRLRVTPNSVTAGGRIFIWVGTTAGISCNPTLTHSRVVTGLAAKKTLKGTATWQYTVPRGAVTATWTARVTCAKLGSASARFKVTALPPPPPTLAPAKVVVVKSGVSDRISDIGSVFAGYGIVLQNTSPDEDALDVEVTANILDANGVILDTDANTYTAIPAGSAYYAGGDAVYDGSTLPARVEVTVQIGRQQKASIGSLPPIANLRVADGFVGIDVLGEFSNPYTKAMSQLARVTAVCFDASGNVIGGDRTYPTADVPPGARIGFDVSIDGLTASQVSTVQASVEPELAG